MMLHVLWQRGRAIWRRREWRSPVLIGTILLSFGLLLVGLVQGWQELARYAWQFDWIPLAWSSLIYSVALILNMAGWAVTMRALGSNATWRQNAKFYLYSWMARRLPTPAPYLTSRVLLYEDIGVPKRITSVGLLWENILLIASSATLTIIVLPISPHIGEYVPEILILLAVAVSMLFVVHPGLLTWLVNHVLKRLKKAPLEVGLRAPVTALALATYAAAWFAGSLILFFVIRTMYPLEWTMLPFIVQCWALSGLISYIVFFAPISFGVREVTLSYLLFSLTSIPLSVAIVVVLLVRIWNMVNELLWAFIIYKL